MWIFGDVRFHLVFKQPKGPKIWPTLDLKKFIDTPRQVCQFFWVPTIGFFVGVDDDDNK